MVKNKAGLDKRKYWLQGQLNKAGNENDSCIVEWYDMKAINGYRTSTYFKRMVRDKIGTQ